MHRINKIIVVLFMPFYVSNAINWDSVPVEETTDAIIDVYDPSDEPFDPQTQRDLADFKTSYEKLYKISGSSYVLPSMQQQPNADDEIEESTNTGDFEAHANDISTTIQPFIEQQTTNQLFVENGAMRSMNDILRSTQRPIALAPYEHYAPNVDPIKRKPTPTIEPVSDDKSEGDLVNETGNSGQQSVVFVQNDSNIHNETADYVNDEAIETNYTQPMTSIPYSMDTTIASQPSSPVFISTRPPSNPISTSTMTSTIVAPAPPATDETMPNQSISKKAKKIEAVPRVYKYSADEIVRKYLDDTFLRAPLATLINTAPEPLRKAKILWKSALRPNTPVDIVLVAFNSSGVGVTYSFKNTPTMIAGLESVQESREMSEGGSGFYGILRASELIPYDSAIFISTDKIPQDISLMKNAATTLLKKRIRLYLIWFGDQDVDENETSTGGSLGEVAIRSGGEILRVTEESLGNGEMGLVTHFQQNDIQGAQVLEIPVNRTDTNLYIQIQGNVDEAMLSTPNDGELVDLFSIDSVRRFSSGSVAVFVPNNPMNQPELIANLNVSNGPTGVYTLKITPQLLDRETQENYNLLINTEYDQLSKKNAIDTPNGLSTVTEEQTLRRRRSQQLSEENVDEEVVWPEYQTDSQIDENTVINNDTEIQSRSGKNILQAVTKIDLGAQSQLLANPGSTVQIHYEITNLRDVPTFHNFQVVDEQRFLRSLNPVSMLLPPGQTRNAVVVCYIPPNIDIGTKDKITFTSQGMNLAGQSAILTVTSPTSAGLDRRAPLIYWNYGSRCYGRTDAGRCAGSIWSLEITTIDPDTGILRVQSMPKGLLIRDQYTAGTTQEVKATYSASCCTPRVSITSYDLAGNQKTITLDVTEYYLEPIEIVAIVLGVILLILIIVAIVWAIVYCCKKRRNTRELPVYRSRSERERAT